MSLKSDIDEGLEFWREASLPGKVFIAVSLILATSSLTSLADVVFEWKGFILQGVEFYQNTLRKPIAWLFSWIHMEGWIVDFLTALFVSLGVLTRVLIRKISSHDEVERILPYPEIQNGCLELLFYLGVGAAFGALIVIPFLLLGGENSPLTLLILALVIMYGFGFMVKVSRPERRLYLSQVTLIVLAVLILAAINAGLNRVS